MKNTFEIAICPWGGEYRPKAGGTVEIIPEKGIQVALYCEETEIRAVNETPDSPVWQDSCLECFIRYYPDDERYINFEVNANGCMLSEIGKDRNRTYLRDMGLELPEVEAIRTEKGWQIRYLVTYELVKKAYGREDNFVPETLMGNFYKCGDETKIPHYISWAPIATENPDFHRPEFFRKVFAVTAKKNPIISKEGICDPHLHIFNNRAYLYASHDAKEGERVFDMYDWEIWSSDDLVTWERESVVRPEETSMGASNDCWAVDAAEKDGRFYLYVSNGTKETYVFSSDDPGKGFVDTLGKPILEETVSPTRSYDPAVFTDEDGASYIIFGTPVWANGDSYYIARLNEDMVSLAEAPKKIILDEAADGADDKPFVHKHNGIYYLSWASFYATSDNVYGPYKTVGNLGLSGDHGSFFEWNEQWFKAFTVDETVGKMRRATGIAYIHYKENGEMCGDMLIREYGVGQYDAAWSRIEAEWFMKGHQTEKKENVFNNFDVILKDGSWVEYPNIHNVPENPWLIVSGVAPEDVEIEVYEGEKLLGILTKKKAFYGGGKFAQYGIASIQLPVAAGDHSIRLVAKGDVKLDYISFRTE